MTGTHSPPPALPAHIQETIDGLARLHGDHHQNATPLQHAVERLIGIVGRLRFIGMVTVLIAAWMGFNILAPKLGMHPVDPPPFYWLETAITIVAFYMVLLILTSQRRADQLAQSRDQLTLELAILSEQKMAKVIELLEEVRRDNPFIHNRVDREADAMSKPADPQTVLDAIKETHAEAEQANVGM